MNQPMDSSISVFSLDADIKINELKKLPALSLNEGKRIFLAVINPNGHPDMAMSNYFYDPVTKAQFNVPQNPKLAKDCEAKFGASKIKFGTIIGVYPTDNYGNPLQGWHPSQIQLYAFVFSTDKFPILKQLDGEWGLASHDLQVTCEEATFQKWRIVACQQALYLSDEASAKEIQEKARKAFGEIKRFLPKTLSEQEIMVKLGQIAPQMPMVQQSPFQAQVGSLPYNPSMPQQNSFMTPPLSPVMPQQNTAPDFKDFVAQPK